MNIVIPAAISPDTAGFFARKCIELTGAKNSNLETDKNFFTLYLLNVSWNSPWRVKLKIALTELRSFLRENPSKREMEAYVSQLGSISAGEHRSTEAYFDKASVFASILADDLIKHSSSISAASLLGHIDVLMEHATEDWQVNLVEGLKQFTVRDSLEANSVTASHKEAPPVMRKTLRGDKTAKAAPADEAPKAFEDGKALAVYDAEKARILLEKHSGGSSLMDQEGNKQKKLLIDLINATGMRELAQYSEEGLQSMYKRFPHFAPVLDFISTSLAMAGCGSHGTPSVLPPILLRGTPGTGKSYFAEELAKVLNTSFVRKDLSVTSEAFVISGLDTSWRGAKPGVVFDTLAFGKYANPVICLDEIDKVRASGFNASPIAALYALLEPATSVAFKDEFLAVELNASKVNWVLTANDGDIPEPVLSRLEVFDIPVPTSDECKVIAQSVWESVCKTVLPVGHGFAETLPEDVRNFMGLLSPRIMRKALAFAVGCAAKDGRKVLQVSDLNMSAERYSPKSKKTIGFVS